MKLAAKASYRDYRRPTTVTGLSNGHLLQCCMQYIVTACRYGLDMRSSLFWDVTQRRLVVTDVSGLYQNVGNYQSTPRNIPQEGRSYTAAEAWYHTHWGSAMSLSEGGSRQFGWNGKYDVSRWSTTFHSEPSARLANVRSPSRNPVVTHRNPCVKSDVSSFFRRSQYVQSSCLDSCAVF